MRQRRAEGQDGLTVDSTPQQLSDAGYGGRRRFDPRQRPWRPSSEQRGVTRDMDLIRKFSFTLATITEVLLQAVQHGTRKATNASVRMAVSHSADPRYT